MEGVQECPVWHQELKQGMGLGVEVALEVGQEGVDPSHHDAPRVSHSPLRNTPGQARSVFHAATGKYPQIRVFTYR